MICVAVEFAYLNLLNAIVVSVKNPDNFHIVFQRVTYDFKVSGNVFDYGFLEKAGLKKYAKTSPSILKKRLSQTGSRVK